MCNEQKLELVSEALRDYSTGILPMGQCLDVIKLIVNITNESEEYDLERLYSYVNGYED